MQEIVFSSHAENKFAILRKHGFDVPKDTLLLTLERPDKVEYGSKNRKIAQKAIDESRVRRNE